MRKSVSGLKGLDTEARFRKTEIVKAGYARWIVSCGASSSAPEVSSGGRVNMPAKRPLIASSAGQPSTRRISQEHDGGLVRDRTNHQVVIMLHGGLRCS